MATVTMPGPDGVYTVEGIADSAMCVLRAPGGDVRYVGTFSECLDALFDTSRDGCPRKEDADGVLPGVRDR